MYIERLHGLQGQHGTHALGALGGQHGQSAQVLSRVARLLRRRLCQHLWLTTFAAVANYFCCCDSMDRMERRSLARAQSASLAPRAAPPLVRRAARPRGPIRVIRAKAGAHAGVLAGALAAALVAALVHGGLAANSLSSDLPKLHGVPQMLCMCVNVLA